MTISVSYVLLLNNTDDIQIFDYFIAGYFVT